MDGSLPENSPVDANSPRSKVLAVGKAVLKFVTGKEPGSVHVTVKGSGAEVTLHGSDAETTTDPPRLSDTERAIVKALEGGRVLNTKQLANATGYSYSGRFRQCLTDLARYGLVLRTPDGYRLPLLFLSLIFA